MSKWEKQREGKTDSTISSLLGAREHTYKNKQTGETRKVDAYSERQAGELISKGKFKK